MYKGYKIIEKGAVVHIAGEDGKVCGVVTPSYAAGKTEKELISEVIRHKIPAKPKTRLEAYCIGDSLRVAFQRECFCPDCGWKLGNMEDEYKYSACANCGQVIDWE